MVQKNKKQSTKLTPKETKKEKISHKEETKSESAVQEYYEVESWQFSGCGD